MKKVLSFLMAVVMMFSIGVTVSAASDSPTLAADNMNIRAYHEISDASYYPEGYIGYQYPVRPGTVEWATLRNHQDMVDACEIPENILAAMSTEELAQTILAYPLIADIFAYDDWSTGTAIVTEHFNGLTRFATMPDSASCLAELYADQTPVLRTELDAATIEAFESDENMVSTDIGYEACNRILRSMVLSVLLAQDGYNEKLAVSDKMAIANAISEKAELIAEGEAYGPEMSLVSSPVIGDGTYSIANPAALTWVSRTGYFHYTVSTSTVKTPKNNSVTVDNKVCVEVWLASDGNEYIRTDLQSSDLPAAYKTTLNTTYYNTYGINPTYNPTVKYNCHSYAWYSQSESNPYWMNDPSKYITDGSYTEVGKIQSVVGDRMVYYLSNTDTYTDISHSAVIKSFVDYPKSQRTFVVTSKWGMLGLYEHSWDNCPYYYINKFPADLKYFHR